jgi:glycosyltransferase involved in cell wall biosynthesis
MARRLVAAGHEVHMITSKTNPSPLEKTWIETNEDGIHVYWLPVPYSNKMSYSERIWAFVKFMWEALWKTHQIGCDVVFATSTPLTIAIPAIYASRLKNVPMVFEVRDLWPELPIVMGVIKNPILKLGASLLEWLAYHNSAHIIALSEGIANGIQSRGYDRSKITIIPNASDTSLFDVHPDSGKPVRERLSMQDSDRLVVFTGTFGEVNGAEYLVDIAKEMYSIDPTVKFLMVGDGKYKLTAIEKARNFGLLDKTVFIEGPVSKKDVPAILSASNITSLFVKYQIIWELITANKLFDSFAAGKPIAINENRVGWLIPLFAETGVGVGLSPVDAHLAAHELYDFLNDEEKLKRATESARNLAYHRFNREILAQRFEEILISVVHENKKGIKNE